MAVLRKMILVYPNAYEKLLQKINYNSTMPTTSNMNEFEKWMEIQQKMLEHKFRLEQQKIRNNLSKEISNNPPEPKKMKTDLENQNGTTSTSTQTDEMVDDISLKDENEDEKYKFYSPKTPANRKVISPRVTAGLKQKHRQSNPMTVTTVFSTPEGSSTSPNIQTRSKTKVQHGKSILKWKCFD